MLLILYIENFLTFTNLNLKDISSNGGPVDWVEMLCCQPCNESGRMISHWISGRTTRKKLESRFINRWVLGRISSPLWSSLVIYSIMMQQRVDCKMLLEPVQAFCCARSIIFPHSSVFLLNILWHYYKKSTLCYNRASVIFVFLPKAWYRSFYVVLSHHAEWGS